MQHSDQEAVLDDISLFFSREGLFCFRMCIQVIFDLFFQHFAPDEPVHPVIIAVALDRQDGGAFRFISLVDC